MSYELRSRFDGITNAIAGIKEAIAMLDVWDTSRRLNNLGVAYILLLEDYGAALTQESSIDNFANVDRRYVDALKKGMCRFLKEYIRIEKLMDIEALHRELAEYAPEIDEKSKPSFDNWVKLLTDYKRALEAGVDKENLLVTDVLTVLSEFDPCMAVYESEVPLPTGSEKTRRLKEKSDELKEHIEVLTNICRSAESVFVD